jgi:hypothetical protein
MSHILELIADNNHQHSSSQPRLSSTSNTKPYHDTSSSSPHTTSFKEDLRTQRIQDFVGNPTDSQVLHHHSSTKESIDEHKRNMKSHLDGFNAKVAGYGYKGWKIIGSTQERRKGVHWEKNALKFEIAKCNDSKTEFQDNN